jgi:SSS family solute:Na+ symporter
MSLSTFLVANGFPESLSNPLHTNMTIVMGTLTIFVIGFVLSSFQKLNSK